MAFENAIVLTGGIATGKSTVAVLLSLRGFKVIDADAIAHKLLNELHLDIAKMFGEELVVSGKVDRKALGKIVFNDDEKREKLEKFLHPKIKEEIEKESELVEKKSLPYLIDIPLFFEKGNYDIEKSLVVYAPRKLQLERMMSRDALSQEDAESRLNAQMDIEEKKSLGSYLIDNSTTLKSLQDQVEKFREEVLEI